MTGDDYAPDSKLAPGAADRNCNGDTDCRGPGICQKNGKSPYKRCDFAQPNTVRSQPTQATRLRPLRLPWRLMNSPINQTVPQDKQDTSVRRIALRTVSAGILLNVMLAVIKAAAGIAGNSYALVADAIESATDAISSLLLLFGLRFALRPADDNHPYGHGRAEALLTFLIVALLVTAAAVIAVESIDHIRTPHDPPEAWTLIVLAGVIVIKELAFRHVSHQSDTTRSTTLKADAWHHRSDAITSLAAFIGICIAILLGDEWAAADDWAALVAALVIIINAWLIFRPALGELMDEQFHHDLVEEIREIAAHHSSVIDTEKCFVRKCGVEHFVDLHLVVDGELSVRKGHDIAHQVKEELMGRLPELSDVLIHVEPSEPV